MSTAFWRIYIVNVNWLHPDCENSHRDVFNLFPDAAAPEGELTSEISSDCENYS